MAAEDKKGEAKEIEHVNPVPEEMSLPSAAIQRIIKSKLPEGVMIGKEAKIAFSKASSIFILYVTTMCAFSPHPLPRASYASCLVHRHLTRHLTHGLLRLAAPTILPRRQGARP